MEKLTIANSLVLPMAKVRRSFDGYVKIHDGIIIEVGAGVVAMATDEQVIDAGGAMLMPGLINAHTHL